MFILFVSYLAFHMLNEENPSTKLRFSSDLLQSPNGNCDGIYTGTITEICGESGCGKTQLCLHLSIHAQKPCSMGGLNTSMPISFFLLVQ